MTSGNRVSVTITPRLTIGVVALAGLLLSAWLLVATAGFRLDADGRDVIAQRLPITFPSAVMPFHQHLNVIPIAIFDRMVAWFGTESNVPFMVLLLATHMALAIGTTALLVRRIGSTWALAIGLPLMLLGSAHYDFVSPWQILFTITLLCGLVAVAASIAFQRTRGKRLVVVAATTIAILTSNVGVFLLVALGLWFVLEGRRNQVRELVPAALVFTAWYFSFGQLGLRTDGDPTSIATFAAVVPYTATALASSAGLGLGPIVGGFVLGVAAKTARPSRALVAFLVAITLMFAAAAFFRSYGDSVQATTSRYIYLAAFITALGVAAAGPSLPERRWVVVAGLAVAAVNVVMLVLAVPNYASGNFS